MSDLGINSGVKEYKDEKGLTCNVLPDVNHENPPVACQHQLQISTNKSNSQTWIDHSSIVDAQNYPKYPKVEKMFGHGT